MFYFTNIDSSKFFLDAIAKGDWKMVPKSANLYDRIDWSVKNRSYLDLVSITLYYQANVSLKSGLHLIEKSIKKDGTWQ